MQHRIHIDLHQIPEILLVAARYRINRLIRKSHGIQIRLQGTLLQLDKGVLHREAVRTAQNRVLQDVRHTCAVGDRRAERNRKYLVAVIVGDQKNSGSRLLVS